MSSAKISVWFFAVAVAWVCGLPGPATATPEFSSRTEQGCLTCHRDEEGGGALTTIGLRFAAAGYRWPPTGGYRVLGTLRRSVRFLVGLLHIVAAFLWFGTILYVHLMLRPAYASKGLPRGEVILGLASMADPPAWRCRVQSTMFRRCLAGAAASTSSTQPATT